MSKKEEAYRLRQEGKTLREICSTLSIAKSTASVWSRQAPLSPGEKKRLSEAQKKNLEDARVKASKTISEKYQKKREIAQQHGRGLTKKGDDLHKSGCLLYWAEGAKNRNQLQFCNTDADMMCLFVRFLRECYTVPDEKVQLSLNVHLDNGLTIEEIENHWLEKLDLPKSCLRGHTVKRNTTSRKAKHPYGVCRISVSSTEIVQSIYGAIQEYFNLDKPEWLDMR